MTIPPYTAPDQNRQVRLISRPIGIPQPEDFRIVEEPLERPDEGQLLVRNLYLSVDPAQRGWAADVKNYTAPVPIGSVMRALGVGIVVESRLPDVAPGDIVYGWTGWQDYARLGSAEILSSHRAPALPISTFAGILGINGMTAWLAFTNLGRPLAGETVLVSTAAGAVGSVVGQLASSRGCHTIGLTSSADKQQLCIDRFGYAAAVDYRAAGWRDDVARHAPDGIDIFFDNVGGDVLDAVLRAMRPGGRVVQCGTASVPAWDPPPRGLRNEREVLSRRLSWNGFVIFDHQAEFSSAIEQLTTMIQAGDLTYEEDIESGIEAAPDALRRLYAGDNRGKKLIFIG